ncbi:MAG: RDD family protein [Gemmatimonadaceae bacterium]
MDQQSRWTESATDATNANGRSDPEFGHGHDSLSAGKADLGKRFIAAVIDGVIGFGIGLIPFVGGLIAAAYWLVRDGLEIEFMDRRSIGKKVMKLRPVRLDGLPMDIPTSVRRNWMFALGGVIQMLMFIPILGWLLMIPVAIVAIALGLLELYKVVTDPQGRRLGDGMAGTRVIEVES